MKVFARWHSPSVFTLILLCFVLPFAVVTSMSGCDGGDQPEAYGKTSFTGIQLVTRTVPRGTGSGDCVWRSDGGTGRPDQCVEKKGATLAEVAFAAAIVGLVLGLLGIAGGGGWCALVGIAALLQLQGTLSGPDLDEFSARAGYLLMLGLFAWAGVLHLVRWWKRRPVRPPRSLGRRAALAAVVIVLIPVSIYAGVMAGGLWITPLFWAAGLYIYRLSTLTPAELEPPPG